MPEKTENIELRSEKVRNIIGQIPSPIIRIGISVLLIIVVVLLAVSYFFCYPDTIQGTARLVVHPDSTLHCSAQITLSYRFITKVQKRQIVTIELEGYTANNYGLLKGELGKIFPKPIEKGGENYFYAEVELSNGMTTTQNKLIPFYPNMKGNAKIIVGEQRLLEKLISPLSTSLKFHR